MAMEVRDSTCESSFLFKLDVFENIHQDITSSCHPIRKACRYISCGVSFSTFVLVS